MTFCQFYKTLRKQFVSIKLIELHSSFLHSNNIPRGQSTCNVSKCLVYRHILKSIVRNWMRKSNKYVFFKTWVKLSSLSVHMQSTTLIPTHPLPPCEHFYMVLCFPSGPCTGPCPVPAQYPFRCEYTIIWTFVSTTNGTIEKYWFRWLQRRCIHCEGHQIKIQFLHVHAQTDLFD